MVGKTNVIKMGRMLKFGEPTKTWTIRTPKSMYNENEQKREKEEDVKKKNKGLL